MMFLFVLMYSHHTVQRCIETFFCDSHVYNLIITNKAHGKTKSIILSFTWYLFYHSAVSKVKQKSFHINEKVV